MCIIKFLEKIYRYNVNTTVSLYYSVQYLYIRVPYIAILRELQIFSENFKILKTTLEYIKYITFYVYFYKHVP